MFKERGIFKCTTFVAGMFILFIACSEERIIRPLNTVSNSDSSYCDTAITYNCQIKTIFLKNCAISECHDDLTKKANISYTNYLNTKAIALNGSRLLDVLNYNGANGYPKMPPPPVYSKLPDSLINKISLWINRGAPE